MPHIRALLPVLALAVHSAGAIGAPPAPGVHTAEPPAEVQTLLTRLRAGDRPASAIQALGARSDAAPYLRLELKAAKTDAYKRELAQALARLDTQTAERNSARYPQWAAGGRLDLCAEALILCPDDQEAVRLANLTVPLRRRIFAGMSETIHQPKVKRDAPWGWEFRTYDKPIHHAGAEVTTPLTFGSYVLARADRLTTTDFEKAYWFAAVRSRLTDEGKSVGAKKVDGKWLYSVVVVNNATTFYRLDESLLVCDGDLDITESAERSAVFVNGTIRAATGGGWESLYCATGDIVLAGRRDAERSVFHAGGTITFAEKPKGSERVRERQERLPYGVRFLDPEEFGVTLAAQNGGVQVLGVAPDSPFARYGVEDGDVITSIDDAKATSIPVFRRQLRQGVLAESTVLRIRRGKLEITRIVFFDGVPTEKAPMPRPAKP